MILKVCQFSEWFHSCLYLTKSWSKCSQKFNFFHSTNRCTRIVALNITSNLAMAQSLPASVKSVLVALLGKRNLLTGPVLRCLAHPDLKRLSLAGSKVRDSTVRILQCLTKLAWLHIPGNEISTLGNKVRNTLHWNKFHFLFTSYRPCPIISLFNLSWRDWYLK